MSDLLRAISRFSPGRLNATDVLTGVLALAPDALLDHSLVRGRRVRQWAGAFRSWLEERVEEDGEITVRDLLAGARVALEETARPRRPARKPSRRR